MRSIQVIAILFCLAPVLIGGCGRRGARFSNIKAEVVRIEKLEEIERMRITMRVENRGRKTTKTIAGFIHFYKGEKEVANSSFFYTDPLPPGKGMEFFAEGADLVEYDSYKCQVAIVTYK